MSLMLEFGFIWPYYLKIKLQTFFSCNIVYIMSNEILQEDWGDHFIDGQRIPDSKLNPQQG